MTRTPLTLTLVLLTALAGAATGCGEDRSQDRSATDRQLFRLDPQDHHSDADAAPIRDDAQTRPAEPARVPASASPELVATRYAQLETNYRWDTLRRQWDQQRRLVTGQEAQRLRDSRPDATTEAQYEAARATSAGQVIGVSSEPAGPGRRRVWVIVRERTGEDGTREPVARYTVREATLRRTSVSWRVESWQILPS